MRIELTTTSLATKGSTAELHPHAKEINRRWLIFSACYLICLRSLRRIVDLTLRAVIGL